MQPSADYVLFLREVFVISTFLCPTAAVCCPLQSVAADSLMSAAIIPSHSVKHKIILILKIRLRLKFLKFMKGLRIQKNNKVLNDEEPVIAVQQL
jgi:hypothetical protein